MRVRFSPRLMPQSVDMPNDDKKRERSCKGALHLRPGTVRDLTGDEVKHIEKFEPQVARYMTEMAPVGSPPATKKPAPKVKSKKSETAPAK